MKSFQILEHPADLKIKVWGKDLPSLFINAARGMYNAASGGEIKTQNAKIKKRKIEIPPAPDFETLLVNFLNELWYLTDINNEIYTDFVFNQFSIQKGIKGEMSAIPIKELVLEIKAVTFWDLEIKKEKGLYQTEIVFDI